MKHAFSKSRVARQMWSESLKIMSRLFLWRGKWIACKIAIECFWNNINVFFRGLSFASLCLKNSSEVVNCSESNELLIQRTTQTEMLLPSCVERYKKLGSIFYKRRNIKYCYKKTFTEYSTCKKSFVVQISEIFNGSLIFKTLKNDTKTRTYCPHIARAACWQVDNLFVKYS